MKKIYTTIFTIFIASLAVSAQVELSDDFESYNLGDISPQAAHWRTWAAPGTSADDANVIDIEAQSGFQSLFIDGSGIQDMILKVPSLPTTGIYTIQWSMKIPSGKEGYFNMQADDTPDGTPWGQYLNGGNVYFNEGGLAPGIGSVDGTPGQVFVYPEGEWFKVEAIYDLDAQTWDMEINDVNQFSGQEFTFNDPFLMLAGINFFSVSTGNEYFIDDVFLGVGILSNNDFDTKEFAAYPNPVNNILNLRANEAITSVAIYNVLGQQVYTAKVGTLNTTIDMSSFNSGAYFVKDIIGDTEGTIKVLK